MGENWPSETTVVDLRCPAGELIVHVIDAQFGVLSGNCSAAARPMNPSCQVYPCVTKRVVRPTICPEESGLRWELSSAAVSSLGGGAPRGRARQLHAAAQQNCSD